MEFLNENIVAALVLLGFVAFFLWSKGRKKSVGGSNPNPKGPKEDGPEGK